MIVFLVTPVGSDSIQVVFATLVKWMESAFNMFLSNGGYVGYFIVCFPIFRLIVRALRSIIKK